MAGFNANCIAVTLLVDLVLENGFQLHDRFGLEIIRLVWKILVARPGKSRMNWQLVPAFARRNSLGQGILK